MTACVLGCTHSHTLTHMLFSLVQVEWLVNELYVYVYWLVNELYIYVYM
jgi:hypothetical protein